MEFKATFKPSSQLAVWVDIYKGHKNLKKFIDSDDLYDDPYYIPDILQYYRISKKYNIKKYNTQDLYDYCIKILFHASSNYDCFYTFADICFLPGIKRDKKGELSAINGAISDAFVDIYEVDELENLSECIYDLESIFNLDNFDDKIEDIMIRIKNKKLDFFHNPSNNPKTTIKINQSTDQIKA